MGRLASQSLEVKIFLEGKLHCGYNARMKRIKPADYVIEIFGGVKKTAKILGRSRRAVYLWRQPRNKGGCDGFLPGPIQYKILRIAKKKKLDITPDDLIYGRTA